VLAFIGSRGFEAPTLEEIASAVGHVAAALAPVLEYLVGQGVLTRTKEGFYFEAERLEGFSRAVIDVLRQKSEIGVAEVKELTGTTRKYTIPLLEYLDGRKVTVRRGDVRVVGPRGRD
jgi:selenocysteine-specific elongation factor